MTWFPWRGLPLQILLSRYFYPEAEQAPGSRKNRFIVRSQLLKLPVIFPAAFLPVALPDLHNVLKRGVMMDLDRKIRIKENLIAEIGNQEAEAVWNRAKEILKDIEARYPDLPKGQRMHAGFIFPAAAIQLAVMEIRGDPMLGYRAISEASWAQSKEMGARLRKTAKIPGFKRLFVRLWGPISRKMFGPDAGFQNVFYPNEEGTFRMDIVQCPYNRYFTELGTPELTEIFCINDECTYGDVPGLEFIRHTTLGTGGDRCDFYVGVKK